jgi:hypothetical protein
MKTENKNEQLKNSDELASLERNHKTLDLTVTHVKFFGPDIDFFDALKEQLAKKFEVEPTSAKIYSESDRVFLQFLKVSQRGGS